MALEGKKGSAGGILAQLGIDFVLVTLSLLFSAFLFYSLSGGSGLPSGFLWFALVSSVFSLLIFSLFGLYGTLWQYASHRDLLFVTASAFTSGLVAFGLNLLWGLIFPGASVSCPCLVFFLHWLLCAWLVGGSRLLYCMVHTRRKLRLLRKEGPPTRVMIVGGGWAGASLVHEMQNGNWGNRIPVLVVDDNRSRTDSRLSGVPVERGTSNILLLASNYRIDEIVISIATPEGDLSELVEKCRVTGYRVRRLGALQEVCGEAENGGA